MSIINDALKKAQQNLNAKDGVAEKITATNPQLGNDRFNPPPAGSASFSKPRKVSAPEQKPAAEQSAPGAERKRKRWPWLLLLLFVLAGFFALFLNLSSTHLASPQGTKENETPEENRSSAFGLTLQGIMTMEGRKIALINDNIYETGDTVSGMKVIRVEANAVYLLKAGKTIVLKVFAE